MIPTAKTFLLESIQNLPQGRKTARILAASLRAVDPRTLIRGFITLDGTTLLLQQHRVNLAEYQRVFLLGIGKAARAMSLSCADLLGNHLTYGFVLTKAGEQPISGPLGQQFQELTGGHPLPNSAGMDSAEKILNALSDLNPDDLVIVLISGGGSALFSLPQPGLTLGDLISTNQVLIGCGADITQINTVRKHLSAVKGGRLAQALFPARMITLILSDVPGNHLESIASGPTLPDPSTYEDALDILRQYNLENKLPPAVVHYLQHGSRGRHPETPKPGNPTFRDSIHLLIGSNREALQGGIRQASEEGFHSQLHKQLLKGEARTEGEEMARLLRRMAQTGIPLERPACLIAGGETTVTLSDTPQPGKGGRNLELALSAVKSLAGLKNCALITLASDGQDGITNAAGAVVRGDSLSRARRAGLDPDQHLQSHNAYPFFDTLGDLLRTGPTGTNVNDLCFLFTYE
jgi:glycerate 2-kinase